MDSIPSCRQMKKSKSFIHIMQKRIQEEGALLMSLPERNDSNEKNG